MPGRPVPKKDVVHCDKRRSAVCRRDQPTISEWGNPTVARLSSRERGAPGELKHLSTRRKREDSASSGERTRSSPNRRTCAAGVVGLPTIMPRASERGGKRDQSG